MHAACLGGLTADEILAAGCGECECGIFTLWCS